MQKNRLISHIGCASALFILVLELKLPESNNIHPRLVAQPTGKQDAHEKLNHRQ